MARIAVITAWRGTKGRLVFEDEKLFVTDGCMSISADGTLVLAFVGSSGVTTVTIGKQRNRTQTQFDCGHFNPSKTALAACRYSRLGHGKTFPLMIRPASGISKKIVYIGPEHPQESAESIWDGDNRLLLLYRDYDGPYDVHVHEGPSWNKVARKFLLAKPEFRDIPFKLFLFGNHYFWQGHYVYGARRPNYTTSATFFPFHDDICLLKLNDRYGLVYKEGSQFHLLDFVDERYRTIELPTPVWECRVDQTRRGDAYMLAKYQDDESYLIFFELAGKDLDDVCHKSLRLTQDLPILDCFFTANFLFVLTAAGIFEAFSLVSGKRILARVLKTSKSKRLKPHATTKIGQVLEEEGLVLLICQTDEQDERRPPCKIPRVWSFGRLPDCFKPPEKKPAKFEVGKKGATRINYQQHLDDWSDEDHFEREGPLDYNPKGKTEEELIEMAISLSLADPAAQ